MECCCFDVSSAFIAVWHSLFWELIFDFISRILGNFQEFNSQKAQCSLVFQRNIVYEEVSESFNIFPVEEIKYLECLGLMVIQFFACVTSLMTCLSVETYSLSYPTIWKIKNNKIKANVLRSVQVIFVYFSLQINVSRSFEIQLSYIEYWTYFRFRSRSESCS